MMNHVTKLATISLLLISGMVSASVVTLNAVTSAQYYSQGANSGIPTNIGGSDFGVGFYGTPHVTKGVIGFGDLPVGTTSVTAATLNVYMSMSDGNNPALPLSFNSHGLTGSWNASTTYAQLSALIGTAGGSVYVPVVVGWYQIDITPIVQNWLTPGSRDVVLSPVFVNEDYQTVKRFEMMGGDHAPYITATVVPEPASMGLVVLSAIALLRRRRV